MGQTYRLLQDQEREHIWTLILLSNQAKSTIHTYKVIINGVKYRVTHDQTFSGQPDPRIEQIFNNTDNQPE